ncbi:MAG: PaaI family thioesterase, partial [Actinomycetia bacterium]|nr:PaaI family thioesterase [Actinomycetes bacterium]
VELNVRFKKPIPLNEEIKVVGRITKETGRYFEGTGEVYLPDGTIAAIGEGKYIKMSIEQISSKDTLESDMAELEWRVYSDDNDPVEIDI